MSDPPGPAPRAEPPTLSAWPAIPRPDEHRRRVLVAEDHPAAADTLAVLLALHGHEVRVAHTGPEAVRLAAGWEPEVVLCDIGLPRLDGYAVAGELRGRAGTAGCLLVAVTAYGSDEDRRRAAEAGFDHHLVKPVDPAELVALLGAAPAGSRLGPTPR